VPLLWAAGIGIVAGLIRRGNLANLGRMRLRGVYLIFFALLIQVLIFPLGRGAPIVTAGTAYLHLLSYALLLAFVVVNRRYPEILVMGVGLLLNLIAIAANGGYMPASVTALRRAGLGEVAAALETGLRHANTVLMSERTRLNFLGDFLYMPGWVPLASAFSVGDVVLGVGLAVLLARRMVKRQA